MKIPGSSGSDGKAKADGARVGYEKRIAGFQHAIPLTFRFSAPRRDSQAAVLRS